MLVMGGVLRAMRFAFAADLGAKLAKAGVSFRASRHCRRGGSANVGAVEARERALDHIGGGVADVGCCAFVAGDGTEHTRLDGALHVLFGFFAHRLLSFILLEFVGPLSPGC